MYFYNVIIIFFYILWKKWINHWNLNLKNLIVNKVYKLYIYGIIIIKGKKYILCSNNFFFLKKYNSMIQ